MKTKEIPKMDSVEELARFWDTHDLTDFQDRLEEVKEPVFERKKATALSINLLPEELDAIGRIANARGVADRVLLREWVLEKLHEF